MEIVEIVDWQVAGRLADLQEAQMKETNQSMISQDGELGERSRHQCQIGERICCD